jgi:hypothetical protein
MSRVEVLSGPERRRRWNLEQKRSIVGEALFWMLTVIARAAVRQAIRAHQKLTVRMNGSSAGNAERMGMPCRCSWFCLGCGDFLRWSTEPGDTPEHFQGERHARPAAKGKPGHGMPTHRHWHA